MNGNLMEDRAQAAIDEVLDNAPLNMKNVRLMINISVDRAIRAHFRQRSIRIWLWVQRVVPILALLVGLLALFD